MRFSLLAAGLLVALALAGCAEDPVDDGASTTTSTSESSTSESSTTTSSSSSTTTAPPTSPSSSSTSATSTNSTTSSSSTSTGPAAPPAEMWFWSYNDAAATCVEDFLIVEYASAVDDGSFCQFQSANPALTAAGAPLTEVATAQAGSAGWATGTAVAGSIYFNPTNPTVGTLDVSLALDDGTVLGTQAVEITHAEPDAYAKADFAFNTAAAIPPGGILVLSMNFNGPSPQLVWGGGGAHPTGLALGGAYAPPTA